MSISAAYMLGMSNFVEADHPRVATGQFTNKPQSAPELTLGDLGSATLAAARHAIHDIDEGKHNLRRLVEAQPAEVVAALRREAGVADVPADDACTPEVAEAAAFAAAWRAEALEAGFTSDELDNIRNDYEAALLWSSVGADGESLDANYGAEDIAGLTRYRGEAELNEFVVRNADDVRTFIEEGHSPGYDLALTRNSHGAGFWDHGLGAAGERLTGAAHALGAVELLDGDDGRLHAF